MHLLLGLTLRWLVFPISIGRLPMSSRVPPTLMPWNFIPRGTILVVFRPPPRATHVPHKQGALVA